MRTTGQETQFILTPTWAFPIHSLCTAQHQHPSPSAPSGAALSLPLCVEQGPGSAASEAFWRAFWKAFWSLLAAISPRAGRCGRAAGKNGSGSGARAEGAAGRGREGAAPARRGRAGPGAAESSGPRGAGEEQRWGQRGPHTSREPSPLHARCSPALQPSPWPPPRSSAARLSPGT